MNERKSPSRKVNELDNRGSHFYLALYWAEELADQNEDGDLKAKFQSLSTELKSNEETIVKELIAVQGSPIDIGGYYFPTDSSVIKAMRPSSTLNAIIGK